MSPAPKKKPGRKVEPKPAPPPLPTNPSLPTSAAERRRAVRVRNAGIQHREPLTEAEHEAMEDVWQHTHDTDARGEKAKP